MVDIQTFFKAVKNPMKAARYGRFEVEVTARRINQYIHQRRGKPKSLDLMERDWDTAIILDACRFDYFKQENTFDGELTQETAPGGASQEFIREMFLGRELHDTICVSGNPFVSLLEPRTFHDLIVDEAWDIGNRQAAPDQVTEAAVRAHNEYPNKRIIVHSLLRRRLLIARAAAESRRGQGHRASGARYVPNTPVRVGIGCSGPAATGSLA